MTKKKSETKEKKSNYIMQLKLIKHFTEQQLFYSYFLNYYNQIS